MGTESKERGSVLLEAAFVLPVIAGVLSILVYFANMFIIHSYVQYGLNQTANEIGGYTYYMEYLGINDMIRKIHSENKENAEKVDSEVKVFTQAYDDITAASEKVSGTYSEAQTLWGEASCEESGGISIENLSTDDIWALVGSVEETGESVKTAASSTKAAFEKLKSYAKDPMQLINMIIGQLKSELTDVVHQLLGNVLGKIVIDKYLDDDYLIASGVVSTNYNGQMTADSYNKGICGMDFRGSTFLADDDCRVVDIVVSYRIKFPWNFSKLAPEGTILHDNSMLIVQRAACYGWVNGDGLSPKDSKEEYNLDESIEEN